jgi:CPA1 family monovalent cation:H+ antiporter
VDAGQAAINGGAVRLRIAAAPGGGHRSKSGFGKEAAMPDIVTPIIGLLVAAIVVARLARLLRLPYTVGLVIAGIAIALAPVQVGITLTHDLIFDVILPPLLFEAAINIHWHELRRDLMPVLTLAILGTVVAAAVIAAGLVYGLGWSIQPALVFGVLIAATDPVAVIALFKDNRIVGRLRLLVESESLFNDGVAAVLFAVVLAWATAGGQGPAGSVDPGAAVVALLEMVGGGVILGGVIGWLAAILAGRVSDQVVEGAVTCAAAYVPFLLAEHFHLSGVLATVTAGLVIGNMCILPSDHGSKPVHAGSDFVLPLWEFIAFLANSAVFLLIGTAVARVAFHDLRAISLVGVVALVLFSRAITVYPICAVYRGSQRAVAMRDQHILWWGGLRGALGLALALALPGDLPMHDEILVAAFTVVAFSVIVQGITMPLLLRYLGFTRGGA